MNKTRVQERLRSPERLYELVEVGLKNHKLVVIYKVGASEIGAKAALSHTSLASRSDVRVFILSF
ncbi:hypothetical protein [Caldalkalibacillus uzonensis]|uniref:hypothetical protein n=1 Tax=Caldalkalibacillus uzonensis TaxID=353224 RepID=UPI0035229B1D